MEVVNCLSFTSERAPQKSRRPLYLQLRSMVLQIRTAAFGLLRAFYIQERPALVMALGGEAITGN